MKKLGIIFGALAAIVLIYFLTLGSSNIRNEAKQQLAQELTLMQQSGFGIHDRVTKEKVDHFIISFDDPKKIAAYLTAQGSPATAEDIEPLKGLELGVDVAYLKDLYSALSLDLYPVKLPQRLLQSAYDVQSKPLLSQIEKLITAKKVLVHVDVAKDLQHFKGFVKDFDETFRAETQTHIVWQDFTFQGSTKEDRVQTMEQKIKRVSVSDDAGFQMLLNNLYAKETMTGASVYDLDADYRIDEMTVAQKDLFTASLQTITVTSSEKVTNRLLESHVTSKIKHMEAKKDGETLSANTLLWDITLSNIDMDAVHALQSLDPQKDVEAIDKAFYALLQKSPKLVIKELSLKDILHNDKKLGEMTLTASLTINKQADLKAALANPLLLAGAIDAQTTLSLSDALFALVAKDPRAMMLMMLIPPKEENGKKVYTIIMKRGKTTVNGIAL